MAFKMKGSPFHKEGKGKKNKKDKTASEPSYKDYAAKFGDFNSQSDTLFVGKSIDQNFARKKASAQGWTSADKGASERVPKDEILTKNEKTGKYTSIKVYPKK